MILILRVAPRSFINITRKMSLQSNKRIDTTLSITEKYSFRGRRKHESELSTTNDNAIKGCETKQRKVDDPDCKSEIVIKKETEPEQGNLASTVNPTIKEEPVESLSSPDKSVSVKRKTTKKVNKNSGVNADVKKMEVDIENCDELLDVKEIKTEIDDKVKWFPNNWEELLKNMQEMRKNKSAPVDDMGCHKTMDENTTPKIRRYQALISLMLSSQTRDQTTFATMLKLREYGLTVESILNIEESELAQLIKSVSFYKVKAKNIKATTKILKDEYDSDIPDSVDKLLKLRGVGPKMAHLCMSTAWGKVHGIGVDTHVHRISNRLKWVKKETKTPEQTRIALESWLPPALWYEVNHLMVGFGQTICLPRYPKCGECLNNNICPFGKKELKSRKNKK